MLHAVQFLREQNPMLGLRGVRLGIHLPELTKMQVRAIFEAACACKRDGIVVKPKIMIPLVALSSELKMERTLLEEEAQKSWPSKGPRRLPVRHHDRNSRAALTADQIAEFAEFFSFGTKRSDADNVRDFARRCRSELPGRISVAGSSAEKSVRDARRARHRQADGHGGAARTAEPART